MNIRRHYIIGAVGLMLLGATACKTTEANYRQAYETARQHQVDRAGGDLPEGVELRNNGVPEPKPLVVNGITLPVVTGWIVSADKDVTPIDSLKRYNVIAGQFRQIFNARQMSERMSAETGTKGVIIKVGSGHYLVGTLTTDSPEAADKELKRLSADKNVKLSAPFPFVFRPAHLAR